MGPKKPSRYFIDEGGLSVGDVGAVDNREEQTSELPAEDDELSVPDEEDDPGVDEAKCPCWSCILRIDETEARDAVVSVEQVDAEEEGVEKPDSVSSNDCGAWTKLQSSRSESMSNALE
jgi:hypothetical protein